MRTWLAVLMVLGIALAGCGDKKDTGVGGSAYETPDKDGGVYVIVVKATNQFDPINAKVPVGATVEWQVENSGCIVKSGDGSIDSSKSPATSGNRYNNGDIPKGDAWRWIAIEGTHEYSCNGKDIRGSIKVS